MVRAEIQRRLDMTHDALGSTLKRMAFGTPKRSQRIHITYWTHDLEGCDRDYPRACYAAGPGVNASKPQPKTASENTRNYRIRKSARTLNSVWALATPVHERLRA